MPSVSKNFLIGLDQTLNTLVYLPGDGWGYVDEMLSARAWRLRESFPWLYRVIDVVFFWDEGHCEECFEMELNQEQFPAIYRKEKS